MAKYSGKSGKVYLGITATTTPTTIIGLNNWTLSMPTDKQEVTEFGDSNKEYVQGLPDISGELSGWWDDTDDNLYDASRSDDGCQLYLYPSTLVATKYWYGQAWTDFSVATPQSGPVTISGSFIAKGSWGQQ